MFNEVQAMTNESTLDLEEQIEAAADGLKDLETADDVRRWWRSYYAKLGHRRLGRLLLGQSVDRLLEQVQKGTAE